MKTPASQARAVALLDALPQVGSPRSRPSMCAHVAESASDVLLASYDAVPYGGGAIAGTRPDYLAAAARLRGLTAPDVQRCRVLDLGCATGGNLLSMALSLPESTFVGIDLSPRQIASARNAAKTLGVSNVQFEAMSITDVDESFGTFDYIVSHGVYSWVPPRVQTALLRVCGRNLAPNGLAYVSYNTYPGWHARGLVRDMMLFHDRPELSPSARVQRARDLLTTVAESVPKSDQVYAAVLQEEIQTLSEASETYFMHEELESENHPVYFIDFAQRAAAVGLQYVSEVIPSLTDTQISGELRGKLRSWSADRLQYEQYFDYVRNRTFRRSLLCHAGREVAEEPTPASVSSMYLRARCFVDADAPEAKQPGVEVFRTAEGVAATMAHPVVRAALHILVDARPAALAFDALFAACRAHLGEDAVSTEVLADAMLRCTLVRLIDLSAYAPGAGTTSISRYPVGSPLARFEARTENVVTSLLHLEVKLSPFDRFVLILLDGTHGEATIIEEVEQAVRRGDLDLGESPRHEAIVEAVGRALTQLRLCGLMIA
jgi:SAM-dependent methyltransferase